MNAWQHFRKANVKGEEPPEIYSDQVSKSRKYQRILILLVIFFSLLAANLDAPGPEAGNALQILRGILFGLFLFYVYAMVRLLVRITQLEKEV
jgi:hypothetical protein